MFGRRRWKQKYIKSFSLIYLKLNIQCACLIITVKELFFFSFFKKIINWYTPKISELWLFLVFIKLNLPNRVHYTASIATGEAQVLLSKHKTLISWKMMTISHTFSYNVSWCASDLNRHIIKCRELALIPLIVIAITAKTCCHLRCARECLCALYILSHLTPIIALWRKHSYYLHKEENLGRCYIIHPSSHS